MSILDAQSVASKESEMKRKSNFKKKTAVDIKIDFGNFPDNQKKKFFSIFQKNGKIFFSVFLKKIEI